MDTIKTVDDLLRAKNLTREEWELFKELIEETKDREKKIAQCSVETKENLKRLSEEINRTLEQTAILSKTLERALDEMETNYLRTMPAHKFYRE
jgi:predicted DNA-binding protein